MCCVSGGRAAQHCISQAADFQSLSLEFSDLPDEASLATSSIRQQWEMRDGIHWNTAGAWVLDAQLYPLPGGWTGPGQCEQLGTKT